MAPARYPFRTLISDMRGDARSVGGQSLANLPITLLLRLSFQLLASYRVARWFTCNVPFAKAVTVPIRYWQNVAAGCQISPRASLGRGVRFPHPLGIVIGEDVIIEDDVVIFQQVTLGSHGRPGGGTAYPTVRQGAVLYAGCKIVGGVTVGRDAVVGANAVVVSDVPDGATAVGVPARMRKRRPEYGE